MVTPFADLNADPAIRGFLHEPSVPSGDAILLTHGAGANCESKLLVEMATALSASGFTVLRLDLPFRALRLHGPPRPGSAARDREGLRRAVCVMRERIGGRIFLGGHSYGGRQATILASEDPGLVDALFLLSYPLHPPRKPTELRTGHFPKLTTPPFFVHGTRDPFGSIAEMELALALIPTPHELLQVEGGGHELLPRKADTQLLPRVANGFQEFVGKVICG